MERMLDATARAEDRHFWFIGLRRFAKQMLDVALPPGAAHRVVDCGAGTGRNLEWLQTYGRVVGIELSETGLAHGRARGRPLARASVAALPLPDASMDLATSFDVLYCLDDETERRAVAEMFRVLRPGGLALVNVAALDVLRGSHSTLTHELRRYTPDRLRRLLEDRGFAIERLTFTNMTTFPVTLAARGLERLTRRDQLASDAELQVPPALVNRLLDVALGVEARLVRRVNLPVGTSLMCLARKPG